MTPAVNILKKSKVKYKLHEYTHDSQAQSYGLEAAQKLGVDEKQVFKTLVVEGDDKILAVGIVPVALKLNMKLIAKALDFKKAKMADTLDVERTTGYVLGGVSPLGQKKKLKTIIDISASQFTTIFISGGRRGLEIELNPNDLLCLTDGKFAQIIQ